MRFSINTFPWGRPDIYPESYGELSLKKDGIFVKLYSSEKYIRATVSEVNGPVYRDSCLEFFFSPCRSKSPAYFNFEANPLGTLYLGYSPDGTRSASAPVDWERYKEVINIKAEISESMDFWSVCYTVPFDFIREYQPDFDPEKDGYIFGNMYKCGDDTKYPHYAVCNPIDISDVIKPDFHVARYFNKMHFVTNDN